MNNDWNDIKYGFFTRPVRQLRAYLKTPSGYSAVVLPACFLILLSVYAPLNLTLREVAAVVASLAAITEYFYFHWNRFDEVAKEIERPLQPIPIRTYTDPVWLANIKKSTVDVCSICGSPEHTHLYCYGTPQQMRHLTPEERDAMDRAFWNSVEIMDEEGNEQDLQDVVDHINSFMSDTTCTRCGGPGYLESDTNFPVETCPACNGTGHLVRDPEVFDVKQQPDYFNEQGGNRVTIVNPGPNLWSGSLRIKASEPVDHDLLQTVRTRMTDNLAPIEVNIDELVRCEGCECTEPCGSFKCKKKSTCEDDAGCGTPADCDKNGCRIK